MCDRYTVKVFVPASLCKKMFLICKNQDDIHYTRSLAYNCCNLQIIRRLNKYICYD